VGGFLPTAVIGLTGSFGSGCSKIAEEIIVPGGYRLLSLTAYLKERYVQETGQDNPARPQLQGFGTALREKNGADCLARLAIEEMRKQSECKKWVIDSIKNPHEAEALRREFSNFFLMGVFADKDVRLKRLENLYGDDVNAFNREDRTDSREGVEHGQRVAACFYSADLVIANNESAPKNSDADAKLRSLVKYYISGMEVRYSLSPTEDEALMTMAYANGQRSSCLKRKVGAVIIDKDRHLFSSGYNEVPSEEKSCKQANGKCNRDSVRDEIKEALDAVVQDPEERKGVHGVIDSLKVLDRCRALHAEENAIINVARFGSAVALSEARLYTTTYPCMMCANKIARVGIKELIYFEPYPSEETRKILKTGSVTERPFQGVTARAYFRFFLGGVSRGTVP
jgi:deoxycytidylate deaminase